MRSANFESQYGAVKAQTDMADYVNLRDQRAMTIELPALELQRAIGDEVGLLMALEELKRRTNETLAALRDTLLPKLLSGEIRIRDAEKAVEAHA
jgi:type I restriction enzyme S subunit